jgi:hypothetical protein
MNYTPKLSHAVFLVFLSFAVFVIGSFVLPDREFVAAIIASVVFMIFSFLVMGFLANEQRIAFYHTIAMLSDSIRNLEADQWQAIGIYYPTLRIKWNGKPMQYLEDTEITLHQLERFMNDSDAKQVVPKRDWTGRQRRVWENIVRWLLQKNYIRHDSATGNHSYLWRGDAFHQLRERYLQIEVIEDDDFMTSAPTTEYTGPLVTESGNKA